MAKILFRLAIGRGAATSEIMSRNPDGDPVFPLVELDLEYRVVAPGFESTRRVRRPTQQDTGHLPRRKGDRLIRRLRVGYRHFAFVQEDLCLVSLDQHIKDRASHGDDRRRRVDAIRIRLTAEFLDVDARLPANYVEESAGRTAQVFDDDRRLRRDHRLRPVRESERQPAIFTGDDSVAGPQFVLDFKGDVLDPGLSVGPPVNLDLAFD